MANVAWPKGLVSNLSCCLSFYFRKENIQNSNAAIRQACWSHRFKSFKSKNKKKLPGLAKFAVVDRRARMAGLADIARLTGVGKFARLIRVATHKYCLVWFELPCWSEWPGSWWWGVSGQE